MLLILDFDGTLADTWPWLADELVLGAAQLGYRPLTRGQVEALRGLETPAVFEALGVERRRLPDLVAHLRRRAELAGDGFRLFDGIPGLVADLRRRGHTLALVSSNAEAAVRATLGPDLEAHFAVRRCGADVFDKASEFVDVMRRTGFPARRTLAVGDETRDLEAARAAGIDAVLVEWGFAETVLLRSRAPGRTAATVEQLVGMITDRELSDS